PDNCWRPAKRGQVTDPNQRGEFFRGQHLRFRCHDLSMDCFGNPAWSILLRQQNKGRLSWRLLSAQLVCRQLAYGTSLTHPAVSASGVKRTSSRSAAMSPNDPSGTL